MKKNGFWSIFVVIGIIAAFVLWKGYMAKTKNEMLTKPSSIELPKPKMDPYLGFNFKQKKAPTAAETDLAAEDALRRPIMKEWLDALDSVANQSQVPEALAINDFIQKHALLAMPNLDPTVPGAVVIEEKPGLNYLVYIVVVMASDLKKNPNLAKQAIDMAASSNYINDGISTITINSFVEFSAQWKGILLLHEGAHCLTFASRLLDTVPANQRRVISEMIAYETEFKILSSLFGEPYKELIAAEAKKAAGKLPKMADYPCESIFGSATSKYESDVQQAIVWFNVVFEFYKSQHGYETALDDFTYFLSSLFEDGKIK